VNFASDELSLSAVIVFVINKLNGVVVKKRYTGSKTHRRCIAKSLTYRREGNSWNGACNRYPHDV
jgi:hypothetical protein